MKNVTFDYTPLNKKPRFTLDVSRIKQIYSGKLNNCRCGCAGDYHTPEDKSYEGMLITIMTAIESGKYEIGMDFWKDEDYIEIQTCEKELEVGDYNDTEIAEMGFGIYLKK
jgi:hypothetical protein